jgi:hypothetical protein
MSRIKISLALLAVLLVIGAMLAPLATAAPPATPQVTQQLHLQDEPPTEVVIQDDSGLPAGIANIFAILGVYVVTMFTMAIGTEVVVDILKVAIGLKSKPEALKTLEEYEKLLPGRLEDLGLSAQAQANLQNQVVALKTLLTPAFKAEEVIGQLQEQNFTAALQTAVGEGTVDNLLAQAAQVTKQQIRTAVSQIDRTTLLGRAVNEQTLAELDKLVDEAAQAAGDVTPEELFHLSRTLVNGKLAETTTTWAEQKLAELRTVSYETAQHLYELQIKPQIKNSGLNQETQERIEMQFQDFLENLRISHQADIYLESVNALLLEVEKRRDETIGVFDRWWTRLRYWLRRQLSRVFKSIDPNPYHKKRNMTINSPKEAATTLLEIKERDKAEAAFRVQQLRILSVIVAVMLAWALQVDSAVILQGLFPPGTNFLYIILLPATFPPFLWAERALNITPTALTAGILLTGLGASAGSSFWHDQLTRLQNVRKGAETANAALQPIINIHSGERNEK